MDKHFSKLFLVVLSVIFATSNIVLAGVFRDNFDDGDAKGWVIVENAPSKWSVIKGGYNGSINDGVESIALIGEDSWEVESIEVKIRDVKGEWLAIVFKYQDINNFESWWLNVPNKTLEAWPKMGNYEGNARATVAVPFDPNKECTIGVNISGDDYDAFFDGKKVGSYKNTKFKTGKVGLLVWASSATFDDVVIKGPNVPTVMAVDPKGKCATFWGKLKE